MPVSCECFVLTSKGLCDGLISRPPECDLETSAMMQPRSERGCRRPPPPQKARHFCYFMYFLLAIDRRLILL